MLVTLILVHSLQWLHCLSISFPDDHQLKRSDVAAELHRSYFGHVNRDKFVTFNHSRRRSLNGNQKGREIVEISPADPTTESTLQSPNYPIDCSNEKECELLTRIAGVETTPLPTFKPYSQEELNFYLKNFVNNNGKLPEESVISVGQPSNKLANLYMDEPVNVLEGSTGKDEGKSQQTSKSWQLMQAQTHKHPYDDHNGWVSLEPVAWSASQVQKWEPNNRPQHPPNWAETNDQHEFSWNRPQSNWQDNSKPWNKKPTYEYKPSSRPPSHWNNYESSHWSGNNPDIITDSRPSHFPHYEPTKKPSWHDRPQTGYNNDQNYPDQKQHNHPSTHPSEGDGRWVLLSSTKGYSVPQRNRAHQRSLFINTKTPPEQPITSLKSHRTVRLTVLPALNGTTNTTTSHGGLLEVEQTFQTVDEAQREHAAKMMRLENLNQGKTANISPIANKRSATTLKIYPVKAPNLEDNSKALLAAVGAGMIPATVAMLVPMVMGRKRRSLSHQQQVYYINNPNRVAGL